jgi:hypothetical protein
MKNVQKLEVFFGISTFVIALLNFLFFVIPSSTNVIDTSPEKYLFWCFVFLFLPELLLAIGTYIHAVKQNIFGLGLLLIFGVLLILFYGMLLLTGIAFYGAKNFSSVLLGLLPSVFAALTIYFALQSKKFSSSLA